ncbi:MAG: cysteine desulfurase [Lachnospiraceae bacterium]|nr:cysteine desulfurase [Lachnospiraceae bacterium]
MKEIYLDNSATTRPDEQVAELVKNVMLDGFGNPSSLHQKGIEAEDYLRKATKSLASVMKVEEKTIYYTSGGTESDNWAVFHAAGLCKRGCRRLITTQIEHPAILEPMKELEKQEYEVVYLPVDERGIVRLDALQEALETEAALVSVMMVNNEVGSIQPIRQIHEILKQNAPRTLLHVDAVQGFGKLWLYPERLGIDLLSVSGHKLHGPKGIGLLYASERSRLRPMIYGGGQQKNMRSGTENVPGIAGLAKAAELAYANLEEDTDRLYALKDGFATELLKLPDVILNGPIADGDTKKEDRVDAPHIVNASFLGIRSEVLLHALEEKGIYVSSGSACSSHKKTKSGTLQAMGLLAERTESALRFSFSVHTTKQELDRTLEELAALLPMLRRFQRR